MTRNVCQKREREIEGRKEGMERREKKGREEIGRGKNFALNPLGTFLVLYHFNAVVH